MIWVLGHHGLECEEKIKACNYVLTALIVGTKKIMIDHFDFIGREEVRPCCLSIKSFLVGDITGHFMIEVPNV